MLHKTTLALCLATATMIAASPASADRDTARFTSLTVFGDSLVDAGNISILTGGATPNAALGYFMGRFTNGYDYTDLLSRDLFGTATRPSLAGGSNFAFGGARIVNNSDGIPDITAQYGAYRVSGQTVDANGLYVLNMGGNDIFAITNGTVPSRFPTTDSYVQAAATEYAATVQALNDAGVRNILITDFPLPASPGNAEANTYLTAALDGLMLDSDTSLFRYSYADFFARVTTNPGAFGLPTLDQTTTCIQANAQASGCVGYFSFDGTHPTAAVQAAAYRDMNAQFGLNAFQAVPEPATWAMMILGIAAVGGAARYRRRTTRLAYA